MLITNASVMRRKIKIRLGGVSEHFNLPIHIAIESKEFENNNIELEWNNCGGGTGQMTQALRNDELDICIVLSEGIISDIIKGNPSKLISVYVKTPLCWGIHTGIDNPLEKYSEIFDKTYAISRFGSGSHLMAIVDANSKSKKIEESQFKSVKNLSNALESLSAQESDVFYWEKFTTKPYVDSGQLKRIGEFFSPWPCFVMAASDKILEENPEEVKSILNIIHRYCDKFMTDIEAIDLVSKRYQLEIQDVEKWYHATEWATNGWISNKMVESIIYNLQLADIVDKNQDIPEIIWKRN